MHSELDHRDPGERAILRALVIRRLILGVAAITLGVCLIAAATWILYTMLTSSFSRGGRGLRKIVTLSYVVGVVAISGGVTILRRDRSPDDPDAIAQDPVPKRLIIIATGTVSLFLCAIAAWPLGAYEWIGGRFTKCRTIITLDELQALSSEPLVEGRGSYSDLTCSLRVNTEAGKSVAIIDVHEDEWTGGYDFAVKSMQTKTAVEGLGTRATRGERAGGWEVAFQVDPSGAHVQLSGGAFEIEDLDAVIAILRERTGLIEPYVR